MGRVSAKILDVTMALIKQKSSEWVEYIFDDYISVYYSPKSIKYTVNGVSCYFVIVDNSPKLKLYNNLNTFAIERAQYYNNKLFIENDVITAFKTYLLLKKSILLQ